MDATSSECDKIKLAFKDRKISEVECWTQMEKMYQYYERKEQKIVNVDKTKIVRYVEVHMLPR